MRQALATVLAAAALAGSGGFLIGLVAGDQPSEPACPTEDSCRAEYEDGEWIIVEVTP